MKTKMKHLYFLILTILFITTTVRGQEKKIPTYHIGIIAPLFLDSVFTGNEFRYNKSFPKFILNGLDFVQGAQIALDSLNLNNAHIVARIIDSKCSQPSLEVMIESGKFDKFDLIIGSIRDADFTAIANFARRKEIPFISATYPNDGGVTQNPYLVILNSTLRAHCEALFSFVLQKYGTDDIYLVRKPGNQEDKVASYFKKANQPDGKELIKIKIINIEEDDFSSLTSKLDSNHTSIIIGGSLDEDFAEALANTLLQNQKKYPAKLIGMPNWDGFNALHKGRIKDIPFYYSAPYFNTKIDTFSRIIQKIYLTKYKGVASDLAYKGFETMYTFGRLLTLHPDNLIENLNENKDKIFSDFNIKPIYTEGEKWLPDYYENKHLFIIRSLNGLSEKMW